MNDLKIILQAIYPHTRKGRLALFVAVFLGAVWSVYGIPFSMREGALAIETGLVSLLFTPLFPWGLATFLRGTPLCPPNASGGCGGDAALLVWGAGWLVYGVLAREIVVSSRGWRIALLWIVFIALLIFNVVGCQAINPCSSGC